ncbi:MAG: FapA family protein [Heliobacteriaceae bacterium]|nr:FapA family protein [Heliobacteriaceae bacterium]
MAGINDKNAGDIVPINATATQEEVIRDGEVKIEIERDQMKASMLVLPPQGGKPVTVEEALSALKAAGVVFGLDSALVKKVIGEGLLGKKMIIARGKPAEDGADARIDYRFDVERQIRPTELDDGRVDFYNLNMIKNICLGEILAFRVPPTDGVPGITVTGRELNPRPGRDKRIQAGKNTLLSEDGCLLTAACPGHVQLTGDRINVDPVYELRGDVDLSSGNLEFIGSIVVHGSITQGFEVRCAGDLEVGGSIEGGSVTIDGNLTVRQGVQGQQKSVVIVGGNVITKFVENAVIRAKGDVIIGEGSMHSEIDAGGSVIVGGKKGLIVGGWCRAGEEIVAKTIGSPHATITELEVGISPEKRHYYNELAQKCKDVVANLDKTTKAIKLLQEWQKRSKLPPEKQVLLEKLVNTQEQVLQEQEQMSQAKRQMDIELEQAHKGRIRAGNIIYSGVGLTIGPFSTRIRDNVEFTTVVIEDGDFRFLPYDT